MWVEMQSLAGDLFVVEALLEQLEDVEFAVGEGIESRSGDRRRPVLQLSRRSIDCARFRWA